MVVKPSGNILTVNQVGTVLCVGSRLGFVCFSLDIQHSVESPLEMSTIKWVMDVDKIFSQ